MRILLYTGKGGVGKTSIAAATALRTAALGYRTLVMSTDQAHSLADCFEIPLSGEPRPVRENLDAMEIDMAAESARAWGNCKDYIREIIAERANGGLSAEEALLFPGLEELSALLRILDLKEENKYEVLVVDCAPTGETLSLLRYPEQLRVLTDKVLPLLRSITSAFGGLISRATTVPKPRDRVFTELEQLVKRLNDLQKLLQDRKQTSLRIVTTPERIVLREAERSYLWLCAFDYSVDAVFANRIWPEEAMRGLFAAWEEVQRENLCALERAFEGKKIFRMQLQEREIRGIDMLERAAQELYGPPEACDPAAVFSTQESYSFFRDRSDGNWYMEILLPGAAEEEIKLEKEENDLILQVRNETRRFHLPEQAASRKFGGWTYADGVLRAAFRY